MYRYRICFIEIGTCLTSDSPQFIDVGTYIDYHGLKKIDYYV